MIQPGLGVRNGIIAKSHLPACADLRTLQMDDTAAATSAPPNSSEVTEDLGVSSSLSSSVKRLVEIARRLTVCNQLESVLSNDSEDQITKGEEQTCETDGNVPLPEVNIESESPKAPSSPEISSATDSASSENVSRRSPMHNTKKWARFLGISPEDIGDEEEFIVSLLVNGRLLILVTWVI